MSGFIIRVKYNHARIATYYRTEKGTWEQDERKAKVFQTYDAAVIYVRQEGLRNDYPASPHRSLSIESI